MALTLIQQVRLAVADIDLAMPLLDDSTYEYFLEKNSDNVNRAAMDAAKSILLLLSQRGSYSVDIFSVSGGHKQAEQYRLALQLFLKDPTLNPVLNNCQGYFGNVSVSDMLANDAAVDNNVVTSPNDEKKYVDTTDYFGV